ncbi:MAG: group II intron reverse transcriptase/maturase [Candidatus Aminicenantes bacterium]|nr:group II intron reverse transcriptase/maturase [Candidatus Aminicenantes bacterium]
MPSRQDPPGAWAHIETPRERTEQEKPIGNRADAGAGTRGKTGASGCQRPVGFGLSHSSEEAREGRPSGGSEGESRAGNLEKGQRNRTPRRTDLSPELLRVEEVARRKPKVTFTSLAHLLTVERLRKAFQGLDAAAAPGVDGVTKADYGQDLERNLSELQARLKAGRYRAGPVLRRWIAKPEGGRRPLGLPTVEDKIVQGAVVDILNAVYEADFYGFSYGYRPNRNAHQALQALQTVLQKGKVNWVLDADISRFFDEISHKRLIAVVRQRVNDGRLLSLIAKWLKAGVVEEDGRRTYPRKGTPQGGVISPLLANIFLHEVVDMFVQGWRKTEAKGEVFIVRYADDLVLAFEKEDDARRMLEELGQRLENYELSLNREKTRLIRFGQQGGETFDFLGFTHIAGRDRQGRYLVIRKTSRKRLNRSLKAVHRWCKKHRHRPVREQYEELSRKLKGHYNYYGLRGNYESLLRFFYRVWRAWGQALSRRGQKGHWVRLKRLLTEVFVLPRPRITHTEGWLRVNPGDLLGRAGCGNAARPVL